MRLGRFSKAIQYYERARENMPPNPTLLDNLALACIAGTNDQRNLERALELINEAIRIAPKDSDPVKMARFFRTKAFALREQDRLEEALECYEQSLERDPGNVDALRSIIRCHWALDRHPPQKYQTQLDEIEKDKQ